MNFFRKKASLWIIAALVIAGGLGAWLKAAAPDITAHWSLIYNVADIILAHYVAKDVKTEDLIHGAIEGMLKALDDPYTRYLPPKGFSEMKIRLDGELTGIGIEIGIKDEHLMVISPIEGSPASKAGLKSFDRIVAVDGEPMDHVALEQAVAKIRGPIGSKVKLTLLRQGEEKPFDITIVREVIKITSVDKVQDFGGGIGYIRLNTFESKTADIEMRNAILKLEKNNNLKALILDLRFNGGGLLDNAIKIASFFIKDGAVVHTVNREGVRDTQYVDGDIIYDKPLLILINEASASASEILAGAVQDHKRGIIMGEHSFGKASVQNIFQLADGSAVLVTVAKYLTPSGKDILKKGIIPDIEVQIPTDDIQKMRAPNYVYSYADDRQIQEAIKYLQKKI